MNSRFFSLLLPLLAVSLLGGCSLKEKYARNAEASRSWLAASKNGTATTNFEGTYYSPEWGAVVLNQNKGRLSGSMAHYHIDGVVSGRTASLLLIDNSWTEYTMVLNLRDAEVLEGNYSAYVPFSDKDAAPVTLYRISR